MSKTRECGPRKDLAGKKFGYLTALLYIKHGKWKCICECNNYTIVDTRNLLSGHTKSCGCKKHLLKNIKDMAGYLTKYIKVLLKILSKSGYAMWNCLCKRCGRQFATRGSHLRSKLILSCGCIHSKNLQNIILLLLNNNCLYKKLYTFNDLKGDGGKNLRFDFAIFKNGILSHLILYNGMQHYIKTLDKWGEQYLQRIKNDQKKILYCKLHNIPLIIIPYDKNYSIQDLLIPVETIPSEIGSRNAN